MLEIKEKESKMGDNIMFAVDKLEKKLLFKVGDDRSVSSKKPIILKVKEGCDNFFVANDDFEIFGEGDTLDHAIEDFVEILRDDYEFFVDSPYEEFDEPAKELKRVFHNAFKEEVL